MRKYAYIFTFIFTLQSCSTGNNYFPDQLNDSLTQSVPSKSIETKSSRQTASIGESAIKFFVKAFRNILTKISWKSSKVLTEKEIELKIIENVQKQIPSLANIKYTSATEMYKDVDMLKNSTEEEIRAIRNSIRSIASSFGVNARHVIEAIQQLEDAKHLKGITPSLDKIPRFDVKETESMAGTQLYEMRSKSANGKIYNFVITGQNADKIKAANTEGKTIWIDTDDLYSKEGIFSGYHYVIKVTPSKMKMDAVTREQLEFWYRSVGIKKFPHFHTLDSFLANADLGSKISAVDDFMRLKVSKGQRVAVVVENPELYIGTQEKGTVNGSALSTIIDWGTENPHIGADEGGHFTSVIIANEVSQLNPSLFHSDKLAVIETPHLNYEDRLAYNQELFKNTKYKDSLPEGYSLEKYSRDTGGLTLNENQEILEAAARGKRKVTVAEIKLKVLEKDKIKFAKYLSGDEAAISAQIVTEVDEFFKELELNNEDLVKQMEEMIDIFIKEGKIDTRGSKGFIFLGAQRTGKTMMMKWMAFKLQAVFYNILKYEVGYVGQSADFALKVRKLAEQVENAIIGFDELDAMPRSMDIKGSSGGVSASDKTATGKIYKETISETPTLKNRTLMLGAVANAQRAPDEFFGTGRFLAVPINVLSEVKNRRKALDIIFEKYRDQVGQVDSQIFDDELVERLPVMWKSDLDELVLEAIRFKNQAGATHLHPNYMEAALTTKTFTPSSPSSALIIGEVNKAFYCSKDYRHLLPKYIQDMQNTAQFAAERDLYMSQGILPNWKFPTWIYGKAESKLTSGAAVADDAAKVKKSPKKKK